MDNDKYIGRMLDNRYEILEVIGTGGMAVVYKARCHRLNRLVAIKILKDDNLDDEDFRRRFHAESQAVAMLSHPNIVSVYDVSTSVMADYIVMELIEGITLKQYMEKKGVLNWKETLHFAMQIAKALEHAHSKGIVHRDIKPHNVMVLKNGSVKVMDFGIARLISHGNTLTKEALGSVHYISPEQARGGRVDDRSDIYSLGVVMYEMMAGRPPYDGDSPVAVAIKHINGGAALPSVLNPNIPGGLEQIIMKAMAHAVADRYPSATRMLADMDEFRKDPTTLFDYTGLPLDAAMRVQSSAAVTPTEDNIANKVVESQMPRRRPVKTPEERRQEARQRREAQKPKTAEEEKRSRITIISIIVCSAVALIALIIVLVLSLGGKSKLIEVPKLVGENFISLPEYQGLTIRKDEVYDQSIAAGVIISQKPEAGAKVEKGTPVVVNVSLGPAPSIVEMSNLVGSTEDKAESILKGQLLNLEVVLEYEYSDTVTEGHIIRTDPTEGTTLKESQKVTLWVSKGKKVQLGAMPNVVGETKDDALKTLELQKLDLKIDLQEVFDVKVPAGTVMSTDPGKGEKLKTGQTVKVVVSKGIEKKRMPEVVGMSLSNAKGMLTQLGFKEPAVVYVDSAEPKDTILTQSLEKEKEYEITTPISLEVSNGSKAPVTMDVTLDLRNSALLGDCHVEIKLDGKTSFKGNVPKGTKAITLYEQTAAGLVKYEIIINGTDGFEQEVNFTANG
ncbi:MAG: Stk1 family PASTA domain-containing Ser/Thr kinase [Oscillospiraceae bacterium]|nr:Stk1 family PASTA domain-containing Ser/Thr kinase [Oscillospiraceae bacterium]